MRIVMIGAGYVGLVSGACFANAGHHVTCVDANAERIAMLKRGQLPIYEPELAELFAANVRARRLFFSTDLPDRVRHAEVVFIAVGTPARRSDGHADLSFVYGAAREMAPALPPGVLVVIKSTVPVGTCDEVESIISEMRPDLDFHVASNPEFLRAGAAVRDFGCPDRVVIGAEDEVACKLMAEVYAPLFHSAAPILYTSRRTAELIKYAANAFLATKITFINEVANLCERVGADVQDVSRGMGLDARIGAKFLDAGPGFGGSCFPKDALALAKMGEDHEVPMRIVETVLAVNEARKRAMARKVAAALGGSLRGKTIALLGLTFKADTDDMREAPSITLSTALSDMHASIRAYDPVGMEQAKGVLPPGITCCSSAYEAAANADALVVVTEWGEFRKLDFDRLKMVMRAPVIIDLRNIYRVEELAPYGFRYYRIGAPQLSPAVPLNARPAETPAPRAMPAKAIRPHANGNGGRQSPRRRSGLVASERKEFASLS